jgi:hypothetical protein
MANTFFVNRVIYSLLENKTLANSIKMQKNKTVQNTPLADWPLLVLKLVTMQSTLS